METTPTSGRVASCDVYFANLSALRPRHSRLLDDIERRRAESYRHVEDRDRFVLGAVLLRIVASRAIGGTPGEVAVDRTCGRCGKPHGKPRLIGAPLEASIAHSGGIVAVAASVDGPVGIDVEARRPFDYRAVLSDVCADDEDDFVDSLDDFYAYWTRKEAFLKATGEGLLRPMRDVGVTPPDLSPAVVRVGTDAPPAAQLVELWPEDGYACAVAVLTSLPLGCTSHGANDLLGHDAP